MHDGGVIAAAELGADLGEREIGDGAGDVHADLPGEGDRVGAALAA